MSFIICTIINVAVMYRADWNEFDVIIMPDVNYRFSGSKEVWNVGMIKKLR